VRSLSQNIVGNKRWDDVSKHRYVQRTDVGCVGKESRKYNLHERCCKDRSH
jgi:hypothetical protein